MTLMNKFTTSTIHFSDSVHPVSTQSRQTQVVQKINLINLLLYLAVQLDLHTVTHWSKSFMQYSQNE